MKKYLLSLLVVGLTTSLFATEDTLPIDSVVNLQGVVVSANKINVNRNSVPLSISVINREEIEVSSESALLPVLSQHVLGLFVTEKGITGFGVNNGSAGTVNIRGVGQGNKVLMLFDGQPQWAGIFGHSLPDTYVASDVEKVEVIRGPGSLLYGSNAMGGVVNIITRTQQQDGRRTQARVMYGSYNTQKYMLNNGFKTGKLSTFVSLNHDRTDGHQANSDFHITNGFGKIGYELNDNLKLTGNVSIAKFYTENPGPVQRRVTDYWVDVVRGTTSYALENNFGKTSGAIRFFYNWGNHEVNDGYYPQEGQSPRLYLFNSSDHNTGILVYQSFRLLPGNTFTLGVDYKNWGGHAWNDSINGNRGEIIDRSINETAAYLIAQQDLFGKLSINAGVRFEHNEAYGSEWVPQAGLTFRPTENNVLKASLSKGFRSPNLRELYLYNPQNPDLRPESMLTYEASFGQSFLDGRLYTELTGFFIDGKDMIETRMVDGAPLNLNVGRFINKGIELETRYQVLNNLHFNMNYSYLHTDKALIAAPTHKFVANATYKPGRFTLNMNVQSIHGLYIATDPNIQEDYTTLNAKIAYQFGDYQKGLNLFLKGENLTAARYQIIGEGYYMPKAIFMGGFDITF